MPEAAVFSVVIPCFNYGHFLAATLDSVARQNRDDIEVVLVDDASTDDTGEVARRYGGQLRYLRNERNLGAGGAWRVGLEHATGQFVMKLDADDALLPGCFDTAEQAFALDPAIGLVISSVMTKTESTGETRLAQVTSFDQTLLATTFRERLLHSFFFRMPGCILRRAILEGHEPPDPELYQLHDWEYFLRVTRGHKARLLSAPGAVYRVHGASITCTALTSDRLYHDIQRWIEVAESPGERRIAADELRQLRGSFGELLLVGIGSWSEPTAYLRFIRGYFRAAQTALGGGLWQLLRLHLSMFGRIFRRMGRSFSRR